MNVIINATKIYAFLIKTKFFLEKYYFFCKITVKSMFFQSNCLFFVNEADVVVLSPC